MKTCLLSNNTTTNNNNNSNFMLQAATTTTTSTIESPLKPTPIRGESELGDEEYYNSLQRYSTLYRILLSRPYMTETKLKQWNRIDLKLVNELGLTLTGLQKHKCWLELGCRLLVEECGQFKTCQTYDISCRPIQHDAWESNTNSDMTGFYYNSEGDFEYMISSSSSSSTNENALCDNNNNQITTSRKYYIQIYPTYKPQQLIQAFPLVIGPITIIESTTWSLVTKKQRRSHSSNKNNNRNSTIECWVQDQDKICQDIFHAYCIRDNTFLVIKENWELGTPGKMWDSALVLSQMFSDKIKSDPTRFKGHRILDLSAGTGCVGLLIALLYKNVYFHQDKPQITMTDLPEALDLIHQNRLSNQLQDYTNIQSLTWGDYQNVQNILRDGPIHTIIASDVLYEPTSFSKLVQTLDWISEKGSTEMDIYLGYKRRGLSGADEQSFFDICAEKFDIYILPIHVEHKLMTSEGWIVNHGNGSFSNIFKETGVNIYQLVRKKNLD